MADLKQTLIAKALGANTKPDGSIDEVKQETEHMSAIDKAMDTAKKLAGVDVLAESGKEKDKKMEKMQEDHDKTKDELQKTQLKLIEEQLGTKIDKLSESIKGGASTKSIGDQISEVNKAAEELGLGGGKVSEFKEIMNLIQSLNPQKGLVDQLKEAKDLIALLAPPEAKREGLVEGVPAGIAVELKKIDSDLKIRLEQMADARQEREQNFKITLLKFEEDRDTRRQEVDGKILVERERNTLISGALKTIGESIGKGLKDATTTSPGITQGAQDIAKHYRVDISKEKDLSEFDCPGCHAKVGIGPTTTLAECINCHSQFEIVRAPAVTSTEASQPAKEGE